MRLGETSVRKLIVLWCVFLAVVYALATFYVVSTIRADRKDTTLRHEMVLDPTRTEPGKTKAEAKTFDLGRAPENFTVDTGIYVDRISEVSIRNSRWVVDFFVWFRWYDKNIRPGQSFHIVNGKVLSKELETSYETADEFYELYGVSAEITKVFDTARFPLDDHLLTIRFEDHDRQFFDLIYVPDVAGSRVSSRVTIPGFEVYDTAIGEKKHSYKTRRGDARQPENYKATFSQLVYGIWIKRSGWALYAKMLLGIVASVAVALIACLVSAEHTDPRFALGIGGFFAAVASTYIMAQKVPESGVMGLSDYVMSFSLITILMTLLTSAMSVHIFNRLNQRALAQKLDRAVLVILVVGYLLFNVSVAGVALI